VPAGRAETPQQQRRREGSEERRAAGLEALLTAGEYEDGFASGRVQCVDEQSRLLSVRAVKRLRLFDRRLSDARRADAGDGVIRDLSPKNSATAQQLKKAEAWKPPVGTKACFAPPRVIQLVFRLGTVRNLSVTDAMRRVGYPELHEQFSVAASSSGVVYRTQYLSVLEQYLTEAEFADCLRVFECFCGSGHQEVDLPVFLVGLQMLLECASPGDTLRYCFSLLESSSQEPRYMTRYEAQTLVMYADEAAVLETKRAVSRTPGAAEHLKNLSQEELVLRCGDRGYLGMRDAILRIVNDPARYDYCGRMPLSDFIGALENFMAELSSVTPAFGSPTSAGPPGQSPPLRRPRVSLGGSSSVAVAGSPSPNRRRSAAGGPSSPSAGARRRPLSPGAARTPISQEMSLSGAAHSTTHPQPLHRGAGLLQSFIAGNGFHTGGSDALSPSASPASLLLQKPTIGQRPDTDSPFVFGRAWQGGAALGHRMSSKKMIIASLTPQQADPARKASTKSTSLDAMPTHD
jgi:hypothetical protein